MSAADENILAAFLAGYVECALWSESIGEHFAADWLAQHGEDFGPDTSLQSFEFGPDDIAAESMIEMGKDCASFIASAAADLASYCARVGDEPSDGLQHAGHDFWLTRNGHGAGFWDRGLGELGDRLTAMAEPYGDCSLYIADDLQTIYYGA